MAKPQIEGKDVVGVRFDKRAYPFRTDVDMWLLTNGYEPDYYHCEESETSYRVMLCGRELAEYDQQSVSSLEDTETMGITYIVAVLLPPYQFQVDFDSASLEDWFQILYTGEFKKNFYEFEITPTVLDAMVSNFSKNVLKKKYLPIDYSHNNEQRAAGWITALKLGDDKKTLYAKAEWTPAGRQALIDREFAYFSAEFILSHFDADDGVDHGPVLRGGALTNIPFLKLPPIIPLHEDGRELSAIFFEEDFKMSEAIKLAEVQAELKKRSDEVLALQETVKKMGETVSKAEAVMAQFAELKTDNDKLKSEIELSKKNKEFDALLAGGLACEAQRAHFLSGDVVKFAASAVKMNPVKPSATPPVNPTPEQLSEAEMEWYRRHVAPKGVKLEDYIKMSRDKDFTVSQLTAPSAAN